MRVLILSEPPAFRACLWRNPSRAGTVPQSNGAHADHAAGGFLRKSVMVRGEEFSKFPVPDVTAVQAVSSCVHPADKDGTLKEKMT
jgi:hypothetical protein